MELPALRGNEYLSHYNFVVNHLGPRDLLSCFERPTEYLLNAGPKEESVRLIKLYLPFDTCQIFLQPVQ